MLEAIKPRIGHSKIYKWSDNTWLWWFAEDGRKEEGKEDSMVELVVQLLGCVWLSVTLCSVAFQAPRSMTFPRQEYWSGLPFPSPGDLPDRGIKLTSSALAGRFFTWAIRTAHMVELNLVNCQWLFIAVTFKLCTYPVLFAFKKVLSIITRMMVEFWPLNQTDIDFTESKQMSFKYCKTCSTTDRKNIKIIQPRI